MIHYKLSIITIIRASDGCFDAKDFIKAKATRHKDTIIVIVRENRTLKKQSSSTVNLKHRIAQNTEH